jgi:MbtH protein
MADEETNATENPEYVDRYRVVINMEEQYSILREQAELPGGWKYTGFEGSEDECLAHIDQVWTDIRPLSMRLALAEQSGSAVNGERSE